MNAGIFFTGLLLLAYGLIVHDLFAIALGGIGLIVSIHRYDDEQTETTRKASVALEREQMAKTNGKPHGNVEIVARSGDE